MAGRKANNSLHRICLLHVQEEIKEKHLYRVFLKKCMKALLLDQNPKKQHPFKNLSWQKWHFLVVIWLSLYKKFYPGPYNLIMEYTQIYHPPLNSSLITFKEPLPKTTITFFQRTLRALEIHLVNLEARNETLNSQLFGKEDIHLMDKMIIMGTNYARLSLKNQSQLRSDVANLPTDIQVRILGRKAMIE